MGLPLVADVDGVRWITIDRPEAANALRVEDLDALAAAVAGIADDVRAVRLCPVPTIAMLNGACVGAAFELSLVCDIRVARRGVRVGLPEVLVGIPSVVDAALLPAFVGLSRAREMILTGGLYSVDELGAAFANRIVEADQLRAETERMLAALTTPTREVLVAQKQLFETWLNAGHAESVQTSIGVFADVFETAATAEAVEAYRAGLRR